MLHPRNNNDSLLIVLDKDGESIRLALIEIKSWLEFYHFYFDGTIDGKKQNLTYEALDNSVQLEKPQQDRDFQLQLHFNYIDKMQAADAVQAEHA